jgi:hypothetical protein
MTAFDDLVDALWREGVGADDRAHLIALLANGPAHAGDEPAPGGVASSEIAAERAARIELAVFLALVELMAGSPIEAPPPPAAGAPPRGWVLASAAAVWSAAIARDGARLAGAVSELERALGGIAPDDPSAAAARGWADLAIAEAALAAGNRTVARRRFEAVASSRAPAVLRVTATLRSVGLVLERADIEQARVRCRRATMLAGDKRPLLAQQARVAAALLDYIAGDREAAERTLADEAGRRDLGIMPRLLLAAIQEPERALPQLADGMCEAAARGDALAYSLYIVAGARRYAALQRDADALLSLTAGMLQLRQLAPTFADALERERGDLRAAWGEARYAEAEAAARATLEAP